MKHISFFFLRFFITYYFISFLPYSFFIILPVLFHYFASLISLFCQAYFISFLAMFICLVMIGKIGHSKGSWKQICAFSNPGFSPPKFAKYGQGFPNLKNDSHPSFKLVVSPSLFTLPSKHLFNTKDNIA